MAGPYTWPSVLFFPIIYFLTLAWVFFLTQAWQWGYATVFGIGLIMFLRASPASVLVIFACYGVAYWGLHVSLARFPWKNAWYNKLSEGHKPRLKTDLPLEVGWPMRQIAPRLAGTEFRIPIVHALLISLLAGWFLFVFTSFEPDVVVRSRMSIGVWSIVCVLAPVVRLIAYGIGFANSLSLRARLASGRLLFPGYDRVYATPVLAWCAGLGYYAILRTLTELERVYSAPVIVALVICMCLAMGPDLREWQLTGKHSLRRNRVLPTDVDVG